MVRFDYAAPETLQEALTLLVSIEGAKPLAGGTDLVLRIKHKQERPSCLVSLRKIGELKEINVSHDGFSIGSMATLTELAKLHGDSRSIALVKRVSALMGTPEIRNVATIGGNVCGADPSGDLIPVLIALGAQAVLVSPQGERKLGIGELILGPRQTALKRGELVRSFQFSELPPNSRIGYSRFATRKYAGIAIASAIAVIVVDDSGICVDATVTLGATSGVPLTLESAGRKLVGEKVTDKLAELVASEALADIEVVPDRILSLEYKLEMARLAVKRAILDACA